MSKKRRPGLPQNKQKPNSGIVHYDARWYSIMRSLSKDQLIEFCKIRCKELDRANQMLIDYQIEKEYGDLLDNSINKNEDNA